MNQFNFILKNFGLDHIKPKLYPTGRKLQPKNSQEDSTQGDSGKREISDLSFNMTTGNSDKPPVSMLGTAVFADVILSTKDESLKMQLIDVLVTVDQTKNIVKTAIQGRNGTVKEFISRGDYMVKLQGRLVSPFSMAYPKEQVADMIFLAELNESLKVVSEFLQLFGIYEIVIDNYSFPQREGFQNIQLFELSCVSDRPIQLQRIAGT
jgi:hypothetical protein